MSTPSTCSQKKGFCIMSFWYSMMPAKENLENHICKWSRHFKRPRMPWKMYQDFEVVFGIHVFLQLRIRARINTSMHLRLTPQREYFYHQSLPSEAISCSITWVTETKLHLIRVWLSYRLEMVYKKWGEREKGTNIYKQCDMYFSSAMVIYTSVTTFTLKH